MLANEEAQEVLDVLLQRPGALKIITSEVRPEYRTDINDPRALPDQDKLAAAGKDLRDPSVMVQHDVVRIELHPVRTSHLVAYSAEGDDCESYDGPLALLVRLIEWRYYDPSNPAATYARASVAVETMYEAASRRAS